MEKRKRKKESNFPWWEKRQQAMERKHGLQESGEYFRLGNREEKARSSQVKWKEPVQSGKDAVKLSAQQKYVLDLIRQGKNVFYTGNAGTGKTTLLREIQKCAPEGTFVTALTGVAAVQAGGMTLHSFAGIGLGNGTKEDLCGIVLRGQKAKNWRNTNVLIIDEVSMLDGKLFDKLDYIARKVRQCDKPFGGIQLVLCGDFFQLPPIQKVGETSVNYCFQSQAWEKVLDYSLELTQIYRQSDPKLIKLLNEVRYQSVSAESLELLKYLKRPLKSSDIEPTKLYSHNKSVNEINNRKLDSLDGEENIYYASDHGQSPYKENLSKYVIAMEKLVLKKGAQVMLLKNLTEELINGSRGVVEEFDEEGWPKVKFTDGTLKTINVVDWNLENSSGIVLARRIQVPLKLAWAITIHKSQGMSIDLLQVDLKQVFSQGQAYVALSRARTLEGLQVLTFDETRFTTSDAVIKFYKNKIQKAPEPQDANSPQEASLCSLTQQSANQGDATTTPSRKRMSEVKAGSSAKKRFSSSSTTNGHSSKAKQKLFYPSEKASSWSCQGESSSMVSSSPHLPYAKGGFRKGSELYLGSPAKEETSSQPYLIEEATDEECLLASPTPSCLVVKRNRPTLSSSLKHSIYHPKDDAITSSTNNEPFENDRQDTGSCNRQNGISSSTCTKGEQNGPSWNSSCDQQDVPSRNNTSCNQQYNSSCNKKPGRRRANRKAARSSSNADSGSPMTKSPFSNKESMVTDRPNSKLEAKFERQREKSKRKCSILFDALKNAESKGDEGNATSMVRKSTCSERNQSSIDIDVSADNRAVKRQRKGNKRTTNIQMLDNENISNELMAVRNDASASQEASVYFDCKPNYDRSSMSVDDESKRRSVNNLVNDSLFPSDHDVSPSSIEVACKWSRERSKIHCRKLFEALKEDDDTGSRIREEEQQKTLLLPYYADENVIDLTSSGHPSASIKLHQLSKSISENIFANGSGKRNSLEYAGYSPQEETGKHKTNKIAATSKNFIQVKDVYDEDTQTEHGSSPCHGDKVSVGKEAFTQTDTYQCEGCLGVEDTPSATDSFSRYHFSDRSDSGVLKQIDTCSRNYSIKKSNDLSGMFFEFKVPSISFAVAQLKSVLLLMFYLAAVMSSLSVQVFYSQFEG